MINTEKEGLNQPFYELWYNGNLGNFIREIKSSNFTPCKTSQSDETICKTDNDCVLSLNHPSFKGVCVNKEWQNNWNKNPESQKYFTDCITGPICSGQEFVDNGLKMPDNPCECVNDSCKTIDLKKYPGCVWGECIIDYIFHN